MQFLLGAGVFATGVLVGAALVQASVGKVLNQNNDDNE